MTATPHSQTSKKPEPKPPSPTTRAVHNALGAVHAPIPKTKTSQPTQQIPPSPPLTQSRKDHKGRPGPTPRQTAQASPTQPPHVKLKPNGQQQKTSQLLTRSKGPPYPQTLINQGGFQLDPPQTPELGQAENG